MDGQAPASAATAVIQTWLTAFDAALTAGDPKAATALFTPGASWRDLLAFTWNVVTVDGREAIAGMLADTLATTRPTGWRMTRPAEGDGAAATAWIAFETPVATGRGRVTVKGGLADVLLTAIADLRGHEEAKGPTRPLGTNHRADRDRRTWTEVRAGETAALGTDTQPEVLVIGGGQGGLALGARLKMLGVPALIVEKNARAGDSWRNRYRSLVLHDPVWYDHLPYLPFPENWPVFTPKDKMGDWLEAYATLMELDLWTSTTCEGADWDEAARRWTVRVIRDGVPVTLQPAQLVFATGAYGPPRWPDWPGHDTFQGKLIHSSGYGGGSEYAGKRVAVVGAASSAHDVALDLWEGGAEVTMIQRNPTTVVRSSTLMELGFDTYSEAALARGVSVEEADWLGAATPFGRKPAGERALYDTIRARDADFYAALADSGFALDFGPDETGLMMKALRTGSGYYIDVGCSDLIVSGAIQVRSGAGVARLTETGLGLTDGTEVAADAIVACTGFESMNETVATIVGRAAADATGICWGLGSGVRGDPGPWQGELRNMYKPTAVEALWYHGGNLALSRFYSRILALQLKARAEGIATPVWRRPAPLSGG